MTVNQLWAELKRRGNDPKGSRNRVALERRLEKLRAGAPDEGGEGTGSGVVVLALKKATKAKPKPTRRQSAESLISKRLAADVPLRKICAELAEKGIERPRGGTDWLPSSVQSIANKLARRAAEAVRRAADLHE